MICNIMSLQIMRWRPVSIKAGYPFRRINGLVSEFSMGGVSTSNNLELCQDAKNVQRKILRVPGFWAQLSYLLRLKTTGKTKARYNKV
ncbi:glycosyltransferase [Salmonella enterica subsp. enterica]|uniref:Glycosyltransferase n=1 Tax=Salmonella enterica I TaxID=59201 RepID=A0A379WR18_SALET|nr:glycosyltransferase [Salmonella enterica subsp. enterica]